MATQKPPAVVFTRADSKHSYKIFLSVLVVVVFCTTATVDGQVYARRFYRAGCV